MTQNLFSTFSITRAMVALVLIGSFIFATSAFAATTATLFPDGQGTYTSWTGDEGDIDEEGTPDCDDGSDGDDNVATATTGNRESVLIDLSSIFNGSTITSVDVQVTYRNGNDVGADDGTFQTFTRLNGTDLDSGTNLVAMDTTCTPGTQTINVADTVKSGATTLEVGVLKTVTDTSEVYVGTVRAVVTYTPVTYTITSSAGAGGTISPNGATVVTGGDDQSYNIPPDAMFVVSDVLVDAISVGRANGYKFDNVAADHTIAASFDGGWTAPTGSLDGDNDVGDDAEAFTSNNLSTDLDDDNDEIDYTTFGLGIPAGAIIDGIEVALEGSREDNRSLGILLSWNGGVNFTATTTLNFAEDETTIVLGNSGDLWGHAWVASEFSDANFRVRVATGNQSNDVNLDQLQVKIHYTEPGHIVVDKVTVPSDAQLFDFDASGGSYADFAITDADTPNDQALAPGVYTITELGEAGWVLTNLVCVDPTDNTAVSVPAGQATIDLASGETVTCTYTNEHETDLTAVKTNNADGGEAFVGVPFDWTIVVEANALNIVDGASTFFDDEVILKDDLPTSGATYGAVVDVNGGGTTGTVDCAIVSDTLTCTANGTVVIPDGGTITVTIPVTPTATGSLVNPESGGICSVDPDNVVQETIGGNNLCGDTLPVAEPATLIIIKDTVPNDTQDFSFTTTGTGLSPFGLDDDGDSGNALSNTQTFTNLHSNIYSVAEGAVFGWSSDGGVCSDGSPVSAIAIGSGETVTCTFTNTPLSPVAACNSQTPPVGFTLLNGSSGHDNVTLVPNTMFVGNGGNDKVKGPNGNYIICLGGGHDKVTLGNGNADIDAGQGNNTVKTGNGNGSIYAGALNDNITTGTGNHTINAGEGSNTIQTGDGTQIVTTGGSADKITTGSGADTIVAGEGNNKVKAGGGIDTITAGAGNDTVDGGAGIDSCNAGGGINNLSNCP